MQKKIILIVIVLCFVGCGLQQQKKTTLLQNTLDEFAATLRWGKADEILNYMDPAVLEKRPIPSFELERLKQFKIARYHADPAVYKDDMHVLQTAQVDLINVNTQAVRTSSETYEWRYDAKYERWWLMSGLPRFQATQQ